MTEAVQKKFVYTPPAPPSNLIESTGFTINFAARKFLNIGLDPANHFNVVAHIITSSRHITMSTDFLRRIFALMGNILSFILEQPVKYKRNMFLEADSYQVSSMVYQSENVLVLEDKTRNGCRVLLNRSDLITLMNLEWSIFEVIVRKCTFIRPAVMQQFEQMGIYFKENFKREENLEDMSRIIKDVSDDLISNHIPKNTESFVSQLKLFAITQLAEQCILKGEPASVSDGTNSEVEEVSNNLSQPKIYNTSALPPQVLYNNGANFAGFLHPTSNVFNNEIQSLTMVSPQSSPEGVHDVNDGPTYFDQFNEKRYTYGSV